MSITAAWPLLAASLTLGLAGSLHCVAMCGGIAAAAGSRMTAGPHRPAALLFNVARIASYGMLGLALATLAGAAVTAAGGHAHLWPLRALAALLMLGLAVQLLSNRDWLGLERLGAALWRRLQPLTGRAARLPGPARFIALGLLWGFLPCGLVYSALALAATGGSPLAGALAMLAFGAGTLPSMLATTLAGHTVLARLGGRNPRRLAGVLMLAFASWTLLGMMGRH
ncbi:MAG: sulfite exporter TauE/SafE family protein [Gammaproteobacteria bacterium]|nr:MAG: sulfite exporter TauE/SafE family protein [Gammaproteobacteria bacterium]